jgi:hypothetical protein
MPPSEPQSLQPPVTVADAVTNAIANANATVNAAANGTNNEPDRPANPDGSDHTESEDEEEQPEQFHWVPIPEDTSEPHPDEIVFIEKKGEHTANDHAYWVKKIFERELPQDKDLEPAKGGRIDWLVSPA